MFTSISRISRLVSLIFLLLSPSSSYTTVIGISQLIDHPALNKTCEGIKDRIATDASIRILHENAQGNIATAALIAQKFVGQNVDVIVAIGTPSAQSALNAVKGTSIPVVFATVTDPKNAHLLANLGQPEGQITGSSNFTAIEPQLKLFQKLTPKLGRLGMIYNPGELNGAIMVEKARDAAEKLNIQVITVAAANTREVVEAARNLVQKVDAFFISNDNTALSAFNSIIKVATDAGIPVYVSDIDLVDKGAVAALGPDQYEVGQSAGDIVLKLLAGQQVRDLAVTFPTRNELYLNLTQAGKIGLNIPHDVIDQAIRKL